MNVLTRSSLLLRRRIAATYFCIFSIKGIPLAIGGALMTVQTFGATGTVQIGDRQHLVTPWILAYIAAGLLLIPFYVSQFFESASRAFWLSNSLWLISAVYNTPGALLMLFLFLAKNNDPSRFSLKVVGFVIFIFGFLSLIGVLLSLVSLDFVKNRIGSSTSLRSAQDLS